MPVTSTKPGATQSWGQSDSALMALLSNGNAPVRCCHLMGKGAREEPQVFPFPQPQIITRTTRAEGL